MKNIESDVENRNRLLASRSNYTDASKARGIGHSPSDDSPGRERPRKPAGWRGQPPAAERVAGAFVFLYSYLHFYELIVFIFY